MVCSGESRFPRYRDAAAVLLRARRGRSCEWAKAFFLLCRAARLPVRLVYDWTDHVWVECALAREDGAGKQVWTHCDVCEGVVGDGLMYERDWGKVLGAGVRAGRGRRGGRRHAELHDTLAGGASAAA
jgi:Transglutaminase-like superfamily